MQRQATALEGTQGGSDVARRSVRAQQDPPAALAQFVHSEHEFGTLDGRRGLAALTLDICHALDGADPELMKSPAPFVRPYPLDTRQERPRRDEARHKGVTCRAIEVAEGLSGWWTTKVSAQAEVGAVVDFTFGVISTPTCGSPSSTRPAWWAGSA